MNFRKILLASLFASAGLPLTMAHAALMSGTFTGVVTDHYDHTGNVTGAVGSDQIINQAISGTITINTALMPTDSEVSPVLSEYSDGLFDWIDISITGVNAPIMPAYDLPNTDFAGLWNNYDKFQLYEYVELNDYATDSLAYHGYKERINLYVSNNNESYSFLSCDNLLQGIHWIDNEFYDSEGNLSLVDGNYGTLFFDYEYQIRDASGAWLTREIASLNLYLSEVNLQPVPVPGAIWLFGSGLLGLIGVARRKKAA